MKKERAKIGEKPTTLERAIADEESMGNERAMPEEEPSLFERAICLQAALLKEKK